MVENDKNNTVLIVEDDMILSMVIEQMVKHLGYEVTDRVKSGEQAIKSALQNEPDVILMDIRLDGNVDGIDAVHKIHSNIEIPVIYITGNNDSRSRERASQTRHIDFLVKPVDQNTLNSALSRTDMNAVTTASDM